MPLAALLLLLAQTDSAVLVRSARRAQAEFERARLALAPPGLSRSAGRCDVLVGRYCYWSDDPPEAPPPEPAAIAAARARLLAVLESAAAVAPGDPWIVGQRVRYLLEAGAGEPAARAADACGAERWWCTALTGLVHHEAGAFAAADSLFQVALDSMPPAERCRWTDLADLLEAPLRDRYRQLSCEARARYDARVWWLAQPLWSAGANDRRTEHFARVTMARLWQSARSPYGLWGKDQGALLVRYGWPVAWEREDAGASREPIAIGHEPEPSYHFLPDALMFDGADPPPGSATLERKDAAERYAPAYLAGFTSLEADFAAFRRGDSTLVVVSYDVSRDTLFADAMRRAALVLMRDPRTPAVVVRRAPAAPAGVLVAGAPWGDGAASLEVVAPARRTAGRARRWLDPGVGIVLFDPGDTLPRDLAEVLTRAHAGPLRRGSRIGLYWEAYGLPPGIELPTAVRVTPERTGWWQRLAGSLHLTSRRGSLRIAWHDVARPDAGRVSRAVVLDLSGLAPGRYRLDVTVAPPGVPATERSRVVEIIAP